MREKEAGLPMRRPLTSEMNNLLTRFATEQMFPLAFANSIARGIDASPGDFDEVRAMMKYEVLLNRELSQR